MTSNPHQNYNTVTPTRINHHKENKTGSNQTSTNMILPHRLIRPIKPVLKNGRSSSSSSNKSTFSPPKAYNKNNIHHRRRRHDNHESNSKHDQSWRKDGKELRKKILEEDDASGGNEFVINKQCKLKNYCAIADRVSYNIILYHVIMYEFLCHGNE